MAVAVEPGPDALGTPPPRPPSQRPSPPAVAALGAVLLLSVFAHFHRLGVTTALLDELTYQRSGLDAVRGTATVPAQPYLARLLFGASQLVLGEGLPAARVVSASASVLTGVVLFAFARGLAGWWAGVGAFALWSALPQATRAPDGSFTMVKLGRSALLEPVMVLFVVLALLAGWRWATSGRWTGAALTGLALGAAVASKPTAGLLVPVIVVGVVAARGASRRTVAQVGALGIAAAAVVVASYLPLGDEAPAAFRGLIAYQTQEHGAAGHPVIVAGDVHATAPWWAFAWWQWRSTGTACLAVLLAAAAAAVVVGPRRRVVLYVAAAAVVPFLALSALAPFGLPHYVHLWQPVLVLLAAVGIAALARRGARERAVAAVLAVVLVVVGVQTLATIATSERQGYGAIGELLASRDLSGASVVVWGQTLVAGAYLPGAQLVLNPGEASRPILAVIVDEGTVARDPRPEVEAFLAETARGFTTLQVDNLVLHVRPEPPVGGGR